MHISEQHEILGQVIARALREPDFRQQFVDRPNEALSSAGVSVPEGVELVVVQNTKDRIFLTLPYLESTQAITPEVVAGDDWMGVAKNTPKDKGCCGGASSVGAVWLESELEAAVG